ncbi:hypothetical protein BASA83_010586 [Batrachochytrium salamandrivorans]|nr:hypothetical protein BASA83_010586 [Batrachochytrium salamandrivorans]
MHSRTYIPSLGQVQIGLQLCAGEPRVKCKIFALAGPQYWPGHRGLSSHWPAVVAYGTILGHSRQVSYTHSNNPDQLGSPSLCILCHAHLDCKPMAHLVVDCTHPTVFFARVDTQLLQAINDTRVQIFDCTLHTTTPPLPPPLPHQLAPVSQQHPANSNPDSTGTSAIWDSMDIHTPIDNYQLSPRTTLSLPQVPLAAPLIFQFFHFHIFHTHTFRAANQRCSPGNSPTGPDTVEENPTGQQDHHHRHPHGCY